MSGTLASPSAFQTQIADAIRDALSQTTARIQRIETPAGQLWLKRIEPLSLRWRLQKGDPVKRFRQDLEGLHLLHDAGLPVAPIVVEGADFYATPHLGPTLSALVREGWADADERAAAFAAAGRALGQMHRSGYSHGRPALRDMCWTGEEVVFIDLERFSPRHGTPGYRALDVVILAHSALADGAAMADLDLTITAYREVAGEAELRRAARIAKGMGWLGPLADLVRRRKPRARDLAAVRPTLDYFARFR